MYMPISARGFTLVELLITLTIITIFGLFSIANFGSFGESQKLKGLAFDVQSFIRSTQTSASSRTACPIGTTDFGANWWTEIQTGNNDITQKCQIGSGTITTTKTYLVNSSSPNLLVDSIKCADNSTTTSGVVTIKYAPLTASVTISDSNGVTCFTTSQFILVSVKNTKTQETKVVKIDKGGTASVE